MTINRLSAILDKQELSAYQLAQKTGHPAHRIKQLIAAPQIPPHTRFLTIQKIAHALNISIDALLGPDPEMVEIHIPGEFPISWNTFYAGKHWSKRSRLAKEIHQLVRAHLDPNWPMFEVPVEIDFLAYFPDKVKLLDWDNIIVKFYVDGLKGWLIEDDTPEYIRAGHVYSYLDRENPRIIMRLYPAKERFHVLAPKP